MTLLHRFVIAIRGLLKRIQPQDVPDGNPEYL